MARVQHCLICDNEMVRDRTSGASVCPTCKTELDTPINLGPERLAVRLKVTPPRVGIHVAGPEDGNVQACARCGDILKIFAPGRQPLTLPGGVFYPPGTLVERGAGWQAIYLGPKEANCV
jgi:hypothetical protein